MIDTSLKHKFFNIDDVPTAQFEKKRPSLNRVDSGVEVPAVSQNNDPNIHNATSPVPVLSNLERFEIDSRDRQKRLQHHHHVRTYSAGHHGGDPLEEMRAKLKLEHEREKAQIRLEHQAELDRKKEEHHADTSKMRQDHHAEITKREAKIQKHEAEIHALQKERRQQLWQHHTYGSEEHDDHLVRTPEDEGYRRYDERYGHYGHHTRVGDLAVSHVHAERAKHLHLVQERAHMEREKQLQLFQEKLVARGEDNEALQAEVAYLKQQLAYRHPQLTHPQHSAFGRRLGGVVSGERSGGHHEFLDDHAERDAALEAEVERLSYENEELKRQNKALMLRQRLVQD